IVASQSPLPSNPKPSPAPHLATQVELHPLHYKKTFTLVLLPLRPCIRSPVSEQPCADVTSHLSRTFSQARRVVFADSLGFSLAAVRVFSEEEGQPELGPLPSLQGLGGMTGDGYSCTLGFPQPSVDFQAFRAKLAESMVTLESCTVTEQALQGTVRVRNLCLQKDVRVRITFDSWGSYRDVPCLYLQKRFGGPQTDIFEFDVAIPKILDAKRKIEFCLMYLPGGQSEPFWDNNNGQNYSILVCVNHAQLFSDPVFEAVGVPVLFAAQVNEEVRGPGGVLWGHVPHDAEGVAGHLTDLDVARHGKGGVHLGCRLPSES
uniref:Protein phosphatase 1 regulatory subunit 3C2, duplicate b n=1 Tax=Kryptolebias marmoratus TaxID=37003 RepID=A0A3Q3EYQ8_KRYMA